MISRLFSLALTLTMIAMSINLVRQSQTLAKLRDQVAEMESRLGSALPPDPSKIWIKLVEAGPEGCAWRMYIPPIKEYRLAMASRESDGELRFWSSSGLRSSKAFDQQSMIRITRSELQGRGSYFVSLLGGRSEGQDLPHVPGLGPGLPEEAIEFEAFAADGEKLLDLDTPIPLLNYRVKETYIQDQLKAGTIDDTKADQLRVTRIWYFGTPAAMDKVDSRKNPMSARTRQ